MFKSEIKGIPCTIKVLSYSPYTPARITPDPWGSYPAEGGWVEWEILDGNGRKNPKIENLLDEKEREMIDEKVRIYLEGWNG